MMFGRKSAGIEGQIDVSAFDFLRDSREFARMWSEEGGEQTFIIDPRALGADPFIFGMATVDAIRHAARAYSQAVGVSEEHALERIFEGFDAERSKNTTGLDTIQDLGEPN